MNSEAPTVLGEFKQFLSANRRGAQYARRVVSRQLHEWGMPYGSEVNDAATHVVAELAANAVTHGRVHGHGFLVKVVWATDTLRISVADANKRRRPEARPSGADADAEGGRGLLLVEALADRWGVENRALGKAVWAEIGLRSTT